MSPEIVAPADWQGGLNTTYYLGAKLTRDENWLVRLKVYYNINIPSLPNRLKFKVFVIIR